MNSVACGSRFPVSSISKNPMLISLNPGLVPLGDSRLADLKKPISETQSPVLCSQSEYQPRRKGLPALFSRHFPQLDLSTVVAPSGGVNEHKLRGSGHRTISPSKGRVPPSTGEHRITSNTVSACVFLHLPRIATPSFWMRPKHYGMQTVQPYVGAVKGISPYIVSQS